jgi:hypothetical protein
MVPFAFLDDAAGVSDEPGEFDQWLNQLQSYSMSRNELSLLNLDADGKTGKIKE